MQYQENMPKPQAASPMRPKTTKHQSQWNFEDFATPAKVAQRIRGQDVVHFSYEDNSADVETPTAKTNAARPRRDNEPHFELQDDGIPIERHVVPKPRKDAETHFQLKDEDTPAPNRTSGRPTSSASSGHGLYANNVIEEGEDDDELVASQDKAPLSTITNNANRRHDFDSHWLMTDAPPANGKTNNENNHPVGHRKAPSQMDSHWATDDQSREPVKGAPDQNRLRKGLESHWHHGAEDQQALTNSGRKPAKNFWDF